MATISGIQSNLTNAVKRLIDADRQNPATMLTPDMVRANPYMRPRGDNGAVDKNEAKGVGHAFTESMFDAAASVEGRNILEGSTSNLRPSVLPAWEVSYGDLRATQSHLNAIVAGLETDANGEVTQAALDNLPQTINDYFKTAWGNTREPPRQVTVDKLAALVREAATGTVDWL